MKQGQDIALLKEVLSLNPYNIPQGRGWLQVAEVLNEAGTGYSFVEGGPVTKSIQYTTGQRMASGC